MTRSINRMAVVGAGVMGTGIAQLAAQAGVAVHLSTPATAPPPPPVTASPQP